MMLKISIVVCGKIADGPIEKFKSSAVPVC
jgi:hypothetical protein